MIVSMVNGRVRVRARVLRSAGAAARVAGQLAVIPGIVDVRPNAAAGCLAINFDPDVLGIEALEERIEALCQKVERMSRGQGRGLPRRLNQATKYGMLATLATSLAFAYLGQKKAHIGFGAAFLGLAGAHLYRYRGSLTR
jgi:hypothetical protein